MTSRIQGIRVGRTLTVASDQPEPQRDTPTRWVADRVWLGSEQLSPTTAIELRDGRFAGIEPGESDEGGMPLGGLVIPGMVNAHSHAFHRLLRGRTHRQGGDFWLWRERMYEIAEDLTPESYEEIATAVYVEMAMAGITTVGEFHYVHHQPGGVPYEDPNEMGHALVRAARRVGIRICLLDVGYFRAGFDDRPLHPYQERFSDGTVDDWLDRVDLLSSAYDASDVVIGVAPHSVRAVPFEALRRVRDRVDETVPVHIHVSEQSAENRDCLEATGMTPTGLLDAAGLLGPMTTLVHATHLEPADIETIGGSGSCVCYCATTERDLADGLGPASELIEVGAGLSVGTDSHAVIDIFEETRGVEMHQRLRTGRRGVMNPVTLMEAATTAGARSLGFPGLGVSIGAPADFVAIDPVSPRLAGLDPTSVDSIVFAATAADVTDTFVSGTRVVAQGHHPEWEVVRDVLTAPRE